MKDRGGPFLPITLRFDFETYDISYEADRTEARKEKMREWLWDNSDENGVSKTEFRHGVKKLVPGKKCDEVYDGGKGTYWEEVPTGYRSGKVLVYPIPRVKP